MGGGVNQQVCENEIEMQNAKSATQTKVGQAAGCLVGGGGRHRLLASKTSYLEDLYGPEIDLLLSEYIILAVLIVANN